MDEGVGGTTPRIRPRTRQRARPLGTFRTRIPKEVPGLVKAAKGQGLSRQPSFKELLRLAEYTAGNNESANLFL